MAHKLPWRIQRKRIKGWRMPLNAFYVGRPTIFGNPFVGPLAIDAFRVWLTIGNMDAWSIVEKISKRDRSLVDLACFERYAAWDAEILLSRLGELRGLNMACWCSLSRPCHADVLLQLANR